MPSEVSVFTTASTTHAHAASLPMSKHSPSSRQWKRTRSAFALLSSAALDGELALALPHRALRVVKRASNSSQRTSLSFKMPLPSGLMAARQRLAAASPRFKLAATSARAFSTTRPASKLIQLEIDGKQVEVEQGSSLIQV